MRDATDLTLGAQAGHVMRAALSGRRALGVAISLALIVLAGIVAPGDAPGAWTWLRVGLVWLFAATALVSIASAPERLRQGRAVSPLLVWGSLLLAVVVSLTFTSLSAAFAVLILILLLVTLQSGSPQQPTAFWAVVVALTPLWVWSAFDAWDRWLLMLVPIGAIGIVAMEHALRADLAGDGRTERLAAWIGVIALAAILLGTVLLTDIDPTWIIGGAIGAVAMAAIDLALVPNAIRERVPSLTLPALALLWLALAWLTAL